MKRKLQIIWHLLRSKGWALYFIDKKGGIYRYLTNVNTGHSWDIECDLAEIREKTETDSAVAEATAILNTSQTKNNE